MTEATQVNDAVARHLAPLGRFLRMEHAFAVGFPDWYYRLSGVSGWLEAKLAPASGRAPAHMTRAQIMWAEEEASCGGLWHLLALAPGRRWHLLDALAARRWLDGARLAEAGGAAYEGEFPVGALIHALAPPHLRPEGRNALGTPIGERIGT